MTLLQLSYVVQVAKCGSMTKAAKELMITQSNLSSSIKAVEKEYGIKIFRRTQYGVEPTALGNQFITYARVIMSSHQEMAGIGAPEGRADFSVVAMMTTFFNDAFIELCVRHQQDQEYNFRLIHQALFPAVLAVEEEQYDVAAIVCSPSSKNRFHDFIKGKRIEAKYLGSVPVFIYLREGHPLLSDGMDAASFPFGKLRDYTFIDYPQGGVRDMMLQEVFPMLPKDGTKTVEMPAYFIRDEIIAQSDGYGIGADRGESRMQSLAKIPIPDSEMEAYCCYLATKPSPLVDEYVKTVSNNLSRII